MTLVLVLTLTVLLLLLLLLLFLLLWYLFLVALQYPSCLEKGKKFAAPLKCHFLYYQDVHERSNAFCKVVDCKIGDRNSGSGSGSTGKHEKVIALNNG